MEAAEKNRAIVEAGLSKRKAARLAQEQAHEDMQRKMFAAISKHHEAEANRRAVVEAEEREKAAILKAQKAQEAAREEARSELSAITDMWNKGLQRIYGALAVGAITCILFVLEGIKMWVAVPVYIGCLGVMLWELVKEVKRWRPLNAAYQKLEDMRE